MIVDPTPVSAIVATEMKIDLHPDDQWVGRSQFDHHFGDVDIREREFGKNRHFVSDGTNLCRLGWRYDRTLLLLQHVEM
jgi:hypothetical protein